MSTGLTVLFVLRLISPDHFEVMIQPNVSAAYCARMNEEGAKGEGPTQVCDTDEHVAAFLATYDCTDEVQTLDDVLNNGARMECVRKGGA